MNGDDIVACIAISFSNLPRVFGRVKMMLRDNCVQYATYKSCKSLFCNRANTIIHTDMPPILKILRLKWRYERHRGGSQRKRTSKPSLLLASLTKIYTNIKLGNSELRAATSEKTKRFFPWTRYSQRAPLIHIAKAISPSRRPLAQSPAHSLSYIMWRYVPLKKHKIIKKPYVLNTVASQALSKL